MEEVKLPKINDNVKTLLEEEPETKGNDKLLIVRYLERFHNAKSIRDILNEDIPSMESITRSRRKLQEKDEYKASRITINNRADNREKFISFFTDEKAN